MPTQVFHFAAQVAVTTSLDDPVDDFEVNARGTLNVLEAMRGRRDAAAARLHVDQQGLRRPRRPGARRATARATRPSTRPSARYGISEARPLDFHSPYGCSKGAADQYVLDYARTFGLPARCSA